MFFSPKNENINRRGAADRGWWGGREVTRARTKGKRGTPPPSRKECRVWPVHVPTESRSRRPPAIDHRLVMSLWDAALGPSRPGHGAAEGGGSQAAEALITEAEQGQPCGNCVQLTDGTGGGGA